MSMFLEESEAECRCPTGENSRERVMHYSEGKVKMRCQVIILTEPAEEALGPLLQLRIVYLTADPL